MWSEKQARDVRTFQPGFTKVYDFGGIAAVSLLCVLDTEIRADKSQGSAFFRILCLPSQAWLSSRKSGTRHVTAEIQRR
jgi:hypothetical protein